MTYINTLFNFLIFSFWF